MTLTITGQPVTKKNSQRIVLVHGRPMPLPSSQYKKYEASALKELAEQYHDDPISYPVNVGCEYYVNSRRRVDLLNLMGATLDILTAAHVLSDDCCTIAVSHDGSKVCYDHDNPHVVVTITKSDYKPFD